MPSARAYFDRFCDFLEQHLGPFVVGPSIDLDPRDESGTLEGEIHLPDGCEIHIALTADCQRIGAADWKHYRFHCQDQHGRCVCRLDNSAHHPELPTFPDHAHRGPAEAAYAHCCPSGHDVVREIMKHHNGHGVARPAAP